ncbi:MAG TPA: ABC transporter permease subunit [Streptosporangiaceae bacterium]|nr:ABC transporter permease subunit [Streptosporangiaceae bacterium]
MSSSAVVTPPSAARRAAAPDAAAQPVTLRRVIRSEWIKFWTLRSTWAVLGAAVVGMLALAVVVAYNTRHLTSNLQANDIAPSSTLQGYFLGELLIGALGVLFVSGEYSTGMIRSTLVAVPRRLPVLWAKLAVFVTVTAVSMVTVSVVAFVSAQALLSRYRTGFSLSDPGVLRVVIGTGVYLTLVGMIGAALGWIVRSTPGALVAYFAIVLVLPVLFGDALGNWGKEVAQFLPGQAGASFSTSIPGSSYSLSPWAGLLVLAGWAAAGLAIAAGVLRRRDA